MPGEAGSSRTVRHGTARRNHTGNAVSPVVARGNNGPEQGSGQRQESSRGSGPMVADTEIVRTDPDQPPVAIRQRTRLSPTARVAYLVIALLGGFSWVMIAIIRGEQVNSVWFVFAAVCTYVIAFRF